MKYLCLAYGDGREFEKLSTAEQEKLFRHNLNVQPAALR